MTLLALAILAAPWLFLELVRRAWPAATSAQGGVREPAASAPGPRPGNPLPNAPTELPVWLAVLVAIVLVVLTLVLVRRQNPPSAGAARSLPVPALEGPEVAAVADARTALQRGSSYRNRVIHAFAAMEAALSSTGVDRVANETPDELLAKIGRLHPRLRVDASRLTDTFQYARFSSGTVTRRHLDVAEASLSAIADATAGARAGVSGEADAP